MYLWNVCVEKLFHCVWVGHADFIVGKANKMAYYMSKLPDQMTGESYRVSCAVLEFPAPSGPSRPDTLSRCSRMTPTRGQEYP